MAGKSFIVTVLGLTALSVYLFVNAPPPLATDAQAGKTIPIEQVMRIVDSENSMMRTLWTKEIVGAGKKVGLKFDEDWREDQVEAGPLPALFLRETANNLEKHPVQLSLYLGSDYPIESSNRFEGVQLEKFRQIRTDGQPQFFYAADTQRNMAMFPDPAVVGPCVTCHNEHPSSPKTDWALNDIMGATTWSYPDSAVTADQLMDILAALRHSFRAAYTTYIDKARMFSEPPQIGDKWPRDGYFLPTPDTFIGEAERRSSVATLNAVISAVTAAQAPDAAAVTAAKQAADAEAS